MRSWTRQVGFPVLYVTRDYTANQIELSQERYFTQQPGTQSPSLWWIPYNYASASNTDFLNTAASAWLPNVRSETITPANVRSTDWVVFNKQSTGYYRVKYDEQNYKLISEELVKGNHSRIHLSSRAQLIDDAFEFAKTSRLNYTIVFDIIKYLEHEVEYVPWASSNNGINYVDRLYGGSAKYNDFAVRKIKQLIKFINLQYFFLSIH